MKKILFIAFAFLALNASAQIRSASLQASGLTCSMCSKAVLKALQAVPFVEKVQVDIKNQQYNLSFKDGAAVRFDALGKAVEEAGFSVASLKATAAVDAVQLEKDKHLTLGGLTVHVLNAAGQTLNGEINFQVVDRSFVSAKEAKKYAGMSKMACVKTGRAAVCCSAPVDAEGRIYHVVI